MSSSNRLAFECMPYQYGNRPPVNPPKEIDDPDDKKPSDWDEREKLVHDN